MLVIGPPRADSNFCVTRRGAASSTPRATLRKRPTPRANTVRPYVPLQVGPVGRGLDPSKTPCVIAKFMVYRRGGFHIRPRNLTQPLNHKKGSRPLPTKRTEKTAKYANKKGHRKAVPPIKRKTAANLNNLMLHPFSAVKPYPKADAAADPVYEHAEPDAGQAHVHLQHKEIAQNHAE